MIVPVAVARPAGPVDTALIVNVSRGSAAWSSTVCTMIFTEAWPGATLTSRPVAYEWASSRAADLGDNRPSPGGTGGADAVGAVM